MLPDRNQTRDTSTRLTLTGHDINGNLLWESKGQKYTSINQMQNSNVYAAKSMQLAGTLGCDQNQYYLRQTSCSGDCRCMDHDTHADMETAWNPLAGIIKAGKGAMAGAKAAMKTPEIALKDIKEALEKAKSEMGSFHNVHATEEQKACIKDDQDYVTQAIEKVNKAPTAK
jgi:hypothetical protein